MFRVWRGKPGLPEGAEPDPMIGYFGFAHVGDYADEPAARAAAVAYSEGGRLPAFIEPFVETEVEPATAGDPDFDRETAQRRYVQTPTGRPTKAMA